MWRLGLARIDAFAVGNVRSQVYVEPDLVRVFKVPAPTIVSDWVYVSALVAANTVNEDGRALCFVIRR